MTRRIRGGDEEDCYTRWRSVMAWTSRPGAVKKVKRRTHKRERRETKAEIAVERAEQAWIASSPQ